MLTELAWLCSLGIARTARFETGGDVEAGRFILIARPTRVDFFHLGAGTDCAATGESDDTRFLEQYRGGAEAATTAATADAWDGCRERVSLAYVREGSL